METFDDDVQIEIEPVDDSNEMVNDDTNTDEMMDVDKTTSNEIHRNSPTINTPATDKSSVKDAVETSTDDNMDSTEKSESKNHESWSQTFIKYTKTDDKSTVKDA